MSVRDLREGIEAGKVLFGVRQALKKGKGNRIFISKDTRDFTVEKLEAAELEFDVLKSKEDLAKELNLDFECEVFTLVK